MNYTEYVNQLSNLMAVSQTNPEFVIFLPGCIDYAEQRIYRELDLLATLTTVGTTLTTTNSREFTLPANFIAVENINVITPQSTQASVGERQPLIPVSLSVVDLLWPSDAANTGVPQQFAMKNNTTIILGPSPDATYYVEVRGITRPQTLSVSNPTTILTTYIPDVFMAASMVYASGFMRNFGAQADNPQMSQSWENQYQMLKQSAEVEQFRAKFQSQSWSSQKPTPANPPRN